MNVLKRAVFLDMNMIEQLEIVLVNLVGMATCATKVSYEFHHTVFNVEINPTIFFMFKKACTYLLCVTIEFLYKGILKKEVYNINGALMILKCKLLR